MTVVSLREKPRKKETMMERKSSLIEEFQKVDSVVNLLSSKNQKQALNNTNEAKEKFSRFGKAADKRARELGIDREKESSESIRSFVYKYKNEIIEDLLRAKKVLVDGVLMLTEVAKGDLPYEKEFVQTKILENLGIPALLLPRYANSFIAKTYGVKIKKKGSFDEAVAYLPNQRAFIEYKHLTGETNLEERLDEAIKKGSEYIFITGKNISKEDVNIALFNTLDDETAGRIPNVIIYSYNDGMLHSNFYETIKNGDNHVSPINPSVMYSTPNSKSREWHFGLATTFVDGYLNHKQMLDSVNTNDPLPVSIYALGIPVPSDFKQSYWENDNDCNSF